MRTPIKIYNVVTTSNPYAGPPGADRYPALFRLADVQIPYACRVVGFNLASKAAATGVIATTFAVFLVVGQSAPEIVVSPTIRTLGSHLYILFVLIPPGIGAQTSSLFFKGTSFRVDANEPIALYTSIENLNDSVVGIASLYVVPDPVPGC